jgi:hypothetical protein
VIESIKTYELPLGNGDTLYKVIIKSPSVEFGTDKSRFLIYEMFKQIAANPKLLTHKGLDFNNITIDHKDGKWVVTTTATKVND